MLQKAPSCFKGIYRVAIPIAGIVLGGKTLIEGSEGFTNYPLFVRLTAVVSYLIGFCADQWTTHRCSSLKPKFEAHGLKADLFEANLFLPKHPTLQQQIISIPSLAVLILDFYVFLDPLIGFGGMAFHLWVAKDNYKLYQDALWELEAEGKEKR